MTDEDSLQAQVAALHHTVEKLTQEMRRFKNDVQVRFEHVNQRFDQLVELFEAQGERMDRRTDEIVSAHAADRKMFYDILGNHEGRIRTLENRPPRPS